MNEPTQQIDTTDSQAKPTVRIAHLVFGVLFLGVAGLWALDATGTVTLAPSVGYLVPGVLVLAGVVGLVAMLVTGRSSSRA